MLHVALQHAWTSLQHVVALITLLQSEAAVARRVCGKAW